MRNILKRGVGNTGRRGLSVRALSALLMCFLVPAGAPWGAEKLDSIVAVVNNDVIVASELKHQIALVIPEIRGRGTKLPPRADLERQVLERMILGRLQLQKAEEAGILVDDAQLTETITKIAARNGMTLAELRATLESQGVRYGDFAADTRLKLVTTRLQTREVVNNIRVTEPEIDRFLERESDRLIERSDVRLSHILVVVAENAPAGAVKKAEAKVADLVRRLRGGADFARVAIRFSDGRRALEGGDLGWFPMGQVPSLAQEAAHTLTKGAFTEPLRSPSGYHIIKLTDLKGSGPKLVNQTNVRHILVRTNEVVSDDDARTRLAQLRLRIVGGDDFATLARSHSDDTGSALKGGSLGWIGPGDTVAAFEKAMNALAPNQVSKPFKSSFGWHIVQVIERRAQDTTDRAMRLKAREMIRERKADEAIDLWLRRLRDEAFVEVRLPNGNK
ncbi:MAG: peptidylprolyl isomerase [Candidatus Thiosymbion ectosymbiont of Robbea hypermnestra]|nr:peptidylprolyl isomerase [Candidatus Thiosymbion ectosymbiont of Robbea hypermnestra]